MDKFLFYREWSRILLEFEIEVMKRNTDLQIITENNKVKWIKKEELD